MLIKKIINYIAHNNSRESSKLIINNIKSVKIEKEKINFNKHKFLIIKSKDNKLFKKLILIFLLLLEKKYKKNFFILYRFKNHLTMNNIIPDWTGNLIKQNFFLNLFAWVKLFFSFFFYQKKVEFLILQKNDDINKF